MMSEKTNKKLDLRYEKYAQVLEKTRWASEFSWKHICKICQYIEPVRAKRGAIVFKEGANERSLGIIVKGSIDIIKGNSRIGIMKSSQTFGEMALIDGEPRSATGVAAEETIIFFIKEKALIKLTEEDPKLGVQLLWKISKLMSQRLRRTTGQLMDYMG